MSGPPRDRCPVRLGIDVFGSGNVTDPCGGAAIAVPAIFSVDDVWQP
ncbi:hypothetical protein [Halorubrum sp. 48-1-W]|nr:hypothetical protein [Halorubrum sp. 48-1-W]